MQIYTTSAPSLNFYAGTENEKTRNLVLLIFRKHWKRFGPKVDDMNGNWRILHTEEFRDLFISPSVAKVVKSRR